MLAPKLRFKEFNDEWKKERLNKISTINPKSDNLPNKFIYIDLESVQKGILLNKNIINKIHAPSRAQRTVKLNDILFQTVRPYQQNNYFVSEVCDIPYIASTGYALIRTNQDPYFIYTLMHRQDFLNKVLDMCTGTSFPAINSNDLGTIEIKIPLKKEQEKISKLFSLLNKKIELQQRKIEVLKMYKKGLTKKLLDYNNYKKIKLKDVCTFYSGGTPDSKNKNFYTGNIPFIRSGEIHNETTELYITSEAIKNSSAKMVYKGSVLYALYGATSGDVSISKIDGAINQAILCINGNNSINNSFLTIYLAFYRNIIINTYLQGGQGNLSADIIKNLLINLPSIEDQTKIVQYINSIDKKLYTENEKLKNINFLKKYLLQQMFI